MPLHSTTGQEEAAALRAALSGENFLRLIGMVSDNHSGQDVIASDLCSQSKQLRSAYQQQQQQEVQQPQLDDGQQQLQQAWH